MFALETARRFPNTSNNPNICKHLKHLENIQRNVNLQYLHVKILLIFLGLNLSRTDQGVDINTPDS